MLGINRAKSKYNHKEAQTAKEQASTQVGHVQETVIVLIVIILFVALNFTILVPVVLLFLIAIVLFHLFSHLLYCLPPCLGPFCRHHWCLPPLPPPPLSPPPFLIHWHCLFTRTTTASNIIINKRT